MKKLLAAVGFLAGMGQAQIGIDVIIRDFPVTHPDFENFSENKDNIAQDSYDGYDAAWKDHGRTCAASNGANDEQYFVPDYIKDAGLENAAKICADGRPCGDNEFILEGLRNTKQPGTPVRYGEFTGCTDGNPTQRGLDYVMKSKGCKGSNWTNLVLVTPGMVLTDLVVPEAVPAGALEGLTPDHYAYPPKNPNIEGCDARNFEQWFQKTDASREVTTQLVLEPVPGEKNVYEVNYDWNNGGYFPLDSIEGTFGKQSLSIMCPPYNYQYAKDQKDKDGLSTYDLCNDWKGNGGPRHPTAAAAAAAERGELGKKHLHNYGFTMAGFANFKYVAGKGEVFEFEGDDDMWIYIDGKLVVDLGGTHLAAPGKLNMDEVADAFAAIGIPWENKSLHKLHFFYADRQTDGSNMRIKMTLSEVIEGVNGAPRIVKAETKSSADNTYTLLYVNTPLNMEVMQQFVNNPDLGYPILVRKADGNVYGYQITSIEYTPTDKDKVYKIYGNVCDENGCNRKLSTGDSLTFNVPQTDDGESNLDLMFGQDAGISIVSERNAQARLLNWGRNSTSLPDVIFDIVPEDPSVEKPNFAVEQMFVSGSSTLTATDGAMGADGTPASSTPKNPSVLAAAGVSEPGPTTVHGFGAPSNTALPLNKTGEMILTAYPSANNENWNQNLPKSFGLPPTANAGVYGLVDPTVVTAGGGVSFLKNGFAGESNVDGSFRVSPARCTYNGTNVNCLNFSIQAKQPFKINVTVFDHLGHYITQYREEVTAQEFRNVTQAANYVTGAEIPEASDICQLPTAGNYGAANALTTNGLVKVNVNLYPFSQTGRRIGNGVYILKVDRIDTEFSGCVNTGGSADMGENKYIRYHDDEKFGWMRTK